MSEKRQKTQAISLLEGILEETQTEAAAERLRMEAELRRKEDAEKAAREQAERQRRAEGERRLAEEDERRRQAAERRAAEIERLRIEELKAKGLWKEPEPAPAPVAAPVPSARPQMSTQEAMAVAAQANRKSTLVPLLIAAVVLLGVAGAGLGYWWSENRVFVDATTVYAKADPQTAALQNAVATIGFEALPPPVILPPPEVATPAATAGPRRTGSSRSGATPAQTGPRRLQLGGNVRDGR